MKNRVIALTAAVSLLFGTAPFGAPVSAAAGTGTLTVTVYDGETGELFTAEDLVFWATGNAADGQSGGGLPRRRSRGRCRRVRHSPAHLKH